VIEKMKKVTKITPFSYMNYRLFLKAYYEHAKKHQRGFSFRSFSKKAGFASPNFLKRVVEGDRSLTTKSAIQVCVGLGLNKQESEFFKNLVAYNQSESSEEKQVFYKKILQSRKFSELKPMMKDQYEYYSSWYNPVVRELIVAKDFDGRLQSICNMIFPKISLKQVEKSVEVLERLGFVKKVAENKWQQSDSLVTAGAQVPSTILYNYHSSCLDVAKYLLFKGDPQRRDVSALTLGVAKERLPQIKKRIQEFRREILEMVSGDTNPDDVVLLSMQLVPLTVKGK
jgi:uncharacterized protein (TIGR02147 family)